MSNSLSGQTGPTPSGGAPLWTSSRILLWACVGLGGLAIALALRHLVIEPHDIGMACAADAAPWWCEPRQAIVMMHIWKIWGWSGLVGGGLGLVFRWRWAIWLGFVMSLMGLVLYNADLAAVGLMLTCLRLPRTA